MLRTASRTRNTIQSSFHDVLWRATVVWGRADVSTSYRTTTAVRVNPICCRGFPATHAQEFAKRERDQFILQRNEGCRGTGADTDMGVCEIPVLDVSDASDVTFVETTCPEF